MMKRGYVGARRALMAILATGALVAGMETANAAVTTTGCAGGSFGAACGLDELLAGGTITVNGYTFANFALSLNGGRLPTASAIRIDAQSVAGAPGISFVDTAATWSTTAGDFTSSNLSFDVFVSGAASVVGATLTDNVNTPTGAASYAYVFGDLFGPGFSTFLGSLANSCDPVSCAVSSRTSFAPASAFSLIGGVDVSADSPGSARLNSFTVTLAVPEPETLALLLMGSVGVAVTRRRGRPTSA